VLEPQKLCPFAMASPTAVKRPFGEVDVSDRRRLGRANKRLCKYVEESKELLNSDLGQLLLQTATSLADFDQKLLQVKEGHAFVRHSLANLRFTSVAMADTESLMERCRAELEVSEDLRLRCAGLVGDIVCELSAQMASNNVAYIVSLEEDLRIERAIHFYKHCGLRIPEVESYRDFKLPNVFEDDDDEIVLRAYNASFYQAEQAVIEVEGIIDNKPLAKDDLGIYTQVLHERAVRLQKTAEQLLSEAIATYENMLGGDIVKALPSLQCSICMVDCVDAVPCASVSCSGAICSGCFGRSVQLVAASAWVGANEVARLTCDVCKEDTYDKRLLNLLPPQPMALYIKAVAEAAAHSARKDQIQRDEVDACTKYAAHRTENISFKDRLHGIERLVVGDLVATKCPGCHTQFYDFDGCCHLTCKECGADFCALCLKGGEGQSGSEVAKHVAECGKGLDNFNNGFIPLADWKRCVGK
jgi:hypothetical protein